MSDCHTPDNLCAEKLGKMSVKSTRPRKTVTFSEEISFAGEATRWEQAVPCPGPRLLNSEEKARRPACASTASTSIHPTTLYKAYESGSKVVYRAALNREVERAENRALNASKWHRSMEKRGVFMSRTYHKSPLG